MTAPVTVTGTSSDTPVTVSPGPGDVLRLTQQIGSFLLSLQQDSNLSVTSSTVSGAIPSLGAGEAFLHGSSADYVIANNGGSLYVGDSVLGRDGSQTLPGDTSMAFTDGVGLFDPTGTAGNVARLYQALLDRLPGADALALWTALIDNSEVPLSAVADAIASSPESFNLYGSMSNAAFINQLFENILGRAANDADQQAWGAALTSGATRGTVAVAIAESQEAKADSLATSGDNNNAEVYRLYQTAFGHAPEFQAEAYWSGLLASGATVGQVAGAIAGSSEFQSDYAAMTVAQFVTALYQNAFHQAPDQGGLDYWSSALQAGVSEAAVLLGFADSLQSRALTASATHANWVFLPSTPLTTEVLLNGPGGRNTSVPGGYNYVVVDDASPDTLSASNAVVVTNSSVSGTFFLSGISTLAANGGDNTVSATGSYNLSFGPGNNSIVAAGSGTISTGLTNGPLGDTVSVTGANNLIRPGDGNMTVTASADSSGLTIDGSSGGGTLDFVGDGNTATIIGGTGGSTVFSGIGGVVATLSGGADSVFGIQGSMSTIFGSSDSNVTFGGPGNLLYSAASGSVTLNAAAASGNITAYLGSSGGADSVTLGSGSDTFTAGAGAETLDAGSGGNLYLFVQGQTSGATDYIGASAGNLANDTFSFVNYSVLPTETMTGDNPTLVLGDGTKLVFTQLTSIASIGHINIFSTP